MSPGRFKSAYNGLTAVARRVYDATPISDDWDVSTIQAELIRLGLPIREYRMLEGVLNSLVHTGLLEEPHKGRFRRSKVSPIKARTAKPEQSPATTEEPATPMATTNTITAASIAAKAEPAEPAGAIDKLAAIAQRTKELSNALAELSRDIENAALDIEEEFASTSKDLEKLRMFKTLMKDL